MVKDREKEKPKEEGEAVGEEIGVTKKGARAFPGDAGINTLCDQCGGSGLIPGQGTTSHMLQLKILHAAMKIEDSAYCP